MSLAYTQWKDKVRGLVLGALPRVKEAHKGLSPTEGVFLMFFLVGDKPEAEPSFFPIGITETLGYVRETRGEEVGLESLREEMEELAGKGHILVFAAETQSRFSVLGIVPREEI